MAMRFVMSPGYYQRLVRPFFATIRRRFSTLSLRDSGTRARSSCSSSLAVRVTPRIRLLPKRPTSGTRSTSSARRRAAAPRRRARPRSRPRRRPAHRARGRQSDLRCPMLHPRRGPSAPTPGPSLPRRASPQAEAVAPSRRPVRFPFSCLFPGECIRIQGDGTRERTGTGHRESGAADGSAEEAPRLRGGHGTRQESSRRLRIRSLGQLDVHAAGPCMPISTAIQAPLPRPRGANSSLNQETARLTPIIAFPLAPRRSSGPFHLAPPRRSRPPVPRLCFSTNTALRVDSSTLHTTATYKCLTRLSTELAHVLRLSPTSTHRPGPMGRAALHRPKHHHHHGTSPCPRHRRRRTPPDPVPAHRSATRPCCVRLPAAPSQTRLNPP